MPFGVIEDVLEDLAGDQVPGALSRLIALTGYSNEADKERALEAGFDAYIVKPFSIKAFIECVEKAPQRAH